MNNFPLVEELSYGRLVTPRLSRKAPVYRWYNLNHSYSRNLVISLLEEFGVESGDYVLDPFCGSGTTLLACREMGVNSVGIDILPLAVFVSYSKMLEYSADRVLDNFKRIFPVKQRDFDFEGSKKYLQKSFSPSELAKLLQLRFSISQMPQPERNFFVLALLNILREISFTKNDGAFIRFKTDVVPEKLEERFPQQVKLMIDDLEHMINLTNESHVLRADARVIPIKDEFFHCVITSPPYLNRHDYTRIYALELLFCFEENADTLKRLRYRMLRSHVEARRVLDIPGYKPSARLVEMMSQLKDHNLSNKQVKEMIWGYFEDMHGVLAETARVIRPGGKVAFVVGNSRYGGIMFPVDELLAEIGENVGLKTQKIIIARYRGNSPQQMKKFGKVSARESIVIWEKR